MLNNYRNILSMLEPCAGKLARTVLRGGEAVWLLLTRHYRFPGYGKLFQEYWFITS